MDSTSGIAEFIRAWVSLLLLVCCDSRSSTRGRLCVLVISKCPHPEGLVLTAVHTVGLPGAKVAVCELPFDYISSDEKGGVGGTCVLRGCVPKKLMVYASEYAEDFKDSAGFG